MKENSTPIASSAAPLSLTSPEAAAAAVVVSNLGIVLFSNARTGCKRIIARTPSQARNRFAEGGRGEPALRGEAARGVGGDRVTKLTARCLPVVVGVDRCLRVYRCVSQVIPAPA